MEFSVFHRRYIMRVLYLVCLYMAGVNIRKEAKVLAEEIKNIFREEFN